MECCQQDSVRGHGTQGIGSFWCQCGLGKDLILMLVSCIKNVEDRLYNQTLVDRVEDTKFELNVDRQVLQGRWKEPGDHTFFKDIKNRDRTEVSSRFVQDENVLQFKSLSFFLFFPDRVDSKMGLERLKLTFQMEDIFRISNVKRERVWITRLLEFLTWDYRYNSNPVEM